MRYYGPSSPLREKFSGLTPRLVSTDTTTMSLTKNPKPPRVLLAVWKSMPPKHRDRFAVLVGTTTGSLRQYIEGRRRIGADLAGKIEKATHLMGYGKINRMQLNDTCKRCEYAQRCLKVDGGMK